MTLEGIYGVLAQTGLALLLHVPFINAGFTGFIRTIDLIRPSLVSYCLRASAGQAYKSHVPSPLAAPSRGFPSIPSVP